MAIEKRELLDAYKKHNSLNLKQIVQWVNTKLLKQLCEGLVLRRFIALL